MRTKKVLKPIKKRIDDYLKCGQRIRKHHNPDSVHDFRIASRNLMVILPLISNGHPSKWQCDIKGWLKELNRLRDLQVLLDRLKGHPAITFRIQNQIDDELKQWRSSHRDIVRKDFRCRLEKELKRLSHHIKEAPDQFARALGQQFLAVQNHLLGRLKKVDTTEPKTLHRLRVAYKSFRYISSLLSEIGMLLKLNRQQLKKWQKLLGDIQDDEVAIAWLFEHWPEERVLIQSLQDHSEQLRRQFNDELKRFHEVVTKIRFKQS